MEPSVAAAAEAAQEAAQAASADPAEQTRLLECLSGAGGENGDGADAAGPPLSTAEAEAWLGLVATIELLPTAIDSRLQREAGLTHFEYLVLVRLAEAEQGTLRMSALAELTNATLPRLSHVVKRMEQRLLLQRSACAEDRRATNATITPAGQAKLEASRPGYVQSVRELFADRLSPVQLEQLRAISGGILSALDPGDRFGVRAQE